MIASIFKDLVSKYLPSVAEKITEKINDKSKEIGYEHKKYLKKDFSTTMKWQSLSTNTSVVAADVVALDSELPLKKRGSYSSAEGDVPKLGMIKSLTESMLQALKNLRARGNKEKEIVKKLFQDAADGIKGVYERLDIMFLQAMSTGVTLIDQENNTGTGIRVDFGIPEKNQFGGVVSWKKENAKPIDDIQRVLTKARSEGHMLRYLWIDRITYRSFKENEQVKKAFAGFHKTNPNYIFRVNQEELQKFLSEEFGLTIIVIDKVIQIEKNGEKTAVEPWKRGNLTFTTTTNMGTLTYGELAEVDHPVKDVEYSMVDNFILVSLFRTNNPLRENTSVQALAIPVLDNVDGIYILDTNEEFDSAGQTQRNDTGNAKLENSKHQS